jgi:quercetin dioxygenase-like cupin family protein
MRSFERTQITLGLLISVPLVMNALSVARSADLPDALAAGWEGQATCEKLDEYEQIRVLRCTFPPGVGHERHSHPQGDFGYVLSGGKMQVTTAKGTEVVEDKTGDYWVSGPIEWHEAVNVGDTTLSYLIIEMKAD